VADHALAQGVEQDVGGRAGPGAARVGGLHIDGEEVPVGEGVQVQEVELPLQVSNITAHWRACHTPPVPTCKLSYAPLVARLCVNLGRSLA